MEFRRLLREVLHWHVGRVARLVQPFRGQIAGLAIEQKEESKEQCVRECKQFLDLPDVQTQPNLLSLTSNANRSSWTVRTDASESYEDLLKHLVYRNTLDPLGPSGQRTVSLQTTVKCYGDNFTYSLPTFTRRLSIDEPIRPVRVELKGDRSIKVTEDEIHRGVSLFDSVSIYTDDLDKAQGSFDRARPTLLDLLLLRFQQTSSSPASAHSRNSLATNT